MRFSFLVVWMNIVLTVPGSASFNEESGYEADNEQGLSEIEPLILAESKKSKFIFNPSPNKNKTPYSLIFRDQMRDTQRMLLNTDIHVPQTRKKSHIARGKMDSEEFAGGRGNIPRINIISPFPRHKCLYDADSQEGLS
ncbi:MAG: hypothetical protein J0H12_06465 [Candidatus Paracaedimonas acanthamoebae]|uniref:Uncharacterized protein n=1 Tax=Candidatus Paracaedimonas acanthamoebae TaxID=244581 RepID=A0A8J7TTN0_9PROT|nr:hypothetical protein [Candidatus Paracaedimonas acanthamoebae]